MQTKTHTHWLKKHSYTQPQALDIPPVHPLKCLHWELRCASSITTGALTGEEPRHVTSDTPLVQTTRLWEVWCQRGVKDERGCDRRCQSRLGDMTIYYWMCCDPDSRKHLGTCTWRSSLVTFPCFFWHLSQTFTAWDSTYTSDIPQILSVPSL